MSEVLLKALHGIEPPSPRRRRRFWMEVLFPILGFYALTCIWTWIVNGQRLSQRIWIGCVLAFLTSGALLLFINLLRTDEVRRLKGNLQDYRMLGFSGSEILWAIAHARIHSAVWFIHVGMGAVVITGALSVGDGGWLIRGGILLLLPLFAEFGLLVIGGTFLDVAMMVKPGVFFYRFAAVVGIFLLGVPAVVAVTVFCERIFGASNKEMASIALLLGVLSWNMRLFFVFNRWDHAARRINAEDCPNLTL